MLPIRLKLLVSSLIVLLLFSTSYAKQGVMQEDLGWYNVLRSGPALQGSTILNAITSPVSDSGYTANTKRVIYIPGGTWVISSSFTVPAHVTLAVSKSTILQVNTSVVLIFEGELEAAPDQQVFSGLGTVQFKSSNPVVYPYWFGVLRDGTSNNTSAFTFMLNSLPNTGSKVVFLPGQHNFGSGVSFLNRRNIDFECMPGAGRSGSTSEQSCTLMYTGSGGSILTAHGAVGVRFTGFFFQYNHASYSGTFIDLSQGSGSQQTSFVKFEKNTFGGLETSSKAASPLVLAAEGVHDIDIIENTFLNASVGLKGSTISGLNSLKVNIERNQFLGGISSRHIEAGGRSWSVNKNSFYPVNTTTGQGLAFNTTSIGLGGLDYIGNNHENGNSASTVWFNITGGGIAGGLIAGNTFVDSDATTSTCVSLGASSGITVTGNTLSCARGLSAGSAQRVTYIGNSFGGSTTPLVGNPVGPNIISTATTTEFGPAGYSETGAALAVRFGNNGRSFEWGHPQTGILNTLGYEINSGKGFICFGCSQATNQDLYKTWGLVGKLLRFDSAGGLEISKITNSNADNQSPTLQMSISADGHIRYSGPAPSLASCGTSPSVNGNDNAGAFTVGTGMGTTCALNFAAPRSDSPICTVVPYASNGTIRVQNITNTGFEIQATPSGNLPDNGIFLYHCFGR